MTSRFNNAWISKCFPTKDSSSVVSCNNEHTKQPEITIKIRDYIHARDFNILKNFRSRQKWFSSLTLIVNAYRLTVTIFGRSVMKANDSIKANDAAWNNLIDPRRKYFFLNPFFQDNISDTTGFVRNGKYFTKTISTDQNEFNEVNQDCKSLSLLSKYIMY